MNVFNFHVRLKTAIEKATGEQLSRVRNDELIDMCSFIENSNSLNEDYDETIGYLKDEKLRRGL